VNPDLNPYTKDWKISQLRKKLSSSLSQITTHFVLGLDEGFFNFPEASETGLK
jgi:hypothetical protein